jgi:hypothetical protein
MRFKNIEPEPSAVAAVAVPLILVLRSAAVGSSLEAISRTFTACHAVAVRKNSTLVSVA